MRKSRNGSARLLAVLFLIPLATVRNAGAQNQGAHQTTPAAVRITSLPINFEPNQGQTTRPARFLARTGATEIDLYGGGFDLSLAAKDQPPAELSVKFVGASQEAELNASLRTASVTNYLIGQDPAFWRTHVPNFGRVTYSHLYSGVDAVFYGNGEQLEHDFVVSPGADYRAIRLQMRGARRLEVDSAGDLRLILTGGELAFHKPVVYQITESGKQSREGHFVLRGDDQVGFAIGAYDHSQPLYIDPVLIYSSYLANLSLDVSAVAADSSGNAYVTGMAFSANYPVTSGAFQSACNSCANSAAEIFITKFNPGGTGQVFSTFLGGSSYNQPAALAVDGQGNTVVAGWTQSTDFPLKNAVSHGYVGGTSGPYGFITSLSPDGSALNFSSILGGAAAEYGGSTTYTNALALDSSGNAYISGTTNSSAFPVTTGALNMTAPAYPGSIVYVSKFSSAGALIYSGLLGNAGGAEDGLTGPMGIGLDANGNAYIAGDASSPWPVTNGAYQSELPADSTTGKAPFVAKVSADGSTLLYSTFLGLDAAVTAIAVDGDGNAFLTGNSAPSSFPTTSNGFLPGIDSGTWSGFLSELNPSGSDLLYSTFLPGTASPTGVALDGSQNVWLAGTTQSAEYPLVNPIQSIAGLNATYSTSKSGFISEFDPTGSSLLFSTYFSGQTFLSTMVGPAFDGTGKLHIAGTADQALYTTPGAYLGSVTPPPPNFQYTYGFVAAIDPAGEAPSLCIAYPANTGINFSVVSVGAAQSQTVTVQNCGTQALTISNVQTSSSAYTIPAATNSCLTTVPVGKTCTLLVNFAPTQTQLYTAALTLTSNAAIPQTSVPLQGQGSVPQVYVSSNSVTLPPMVVGATSTAAYLQIGNSSWVPLIVDLAHTTITASFAFTQQGCNVPLGTCYMQVTFTPLAQGTVTGTLTIVTNDPVTPNYTVNLSGVGLAAYPVPSVTSVNPATIAIGSSSVQLSVGGQNFFPGSVIKVNGTALNTTYDDSTYLWATLDASAFTSMSEVPLTVVNPSPGGGESTPITLNIYRSIPAQVSAMVYEPFSQLLYAAIPASAATNPNSIVSIDPLTGTIGTPLAVGDDPESLALSGDGRYLYVGVNGINAIQRINLATMSIEKSFPLPVDTLAGPLTVHEMHVVPGSPQTIVAALWTNGDPPEDGMAIFNDAGLINWIANGYPNYLAVDSFAIMGNPPVIYAPPYTYDSTPVFPIVTIGSSGLQYTRLSTVGVYGPSGPVVSDGTLLYEASGQVWNPTTQSLVGTYTSSDTMQAVSVIPDDSLGLTFFLDRFSACSAQSGGMCAFNQASFSLTGSLPFPAIWGPYQNGLVRWGNEGFAFFANDSTDATQDQIAIFRSSIAHVSTSSNPAPGLSALSAPTAAEGGADFLLGVTGTGFVRGAVVNWNGNPRTTVYASATQLSAYIPSTDIAATTSAQITVTDPAPGGGTSSPLTLTLGAETQMGINPTSLTFNPQAVGSSSTSQPIVITNSGTATLYLVVSSSGEFSQTNNCGEPLGAGANCTINVTFTPLAGGTRNGSIILLDNAANSPQTVGLTGTGQGPAVSLSPGSLTFGSQFVGSSSSAQTVTVSNTGNAPLTISAIASTESEFIETNTCGSSLAAGGQCTIQVTFKPYDTGSRMGTITVTDNMGGAPQPVFLSGWGQAKSVYLGGSTFVPDVQLGQTATIGQLTLENTGTVTVTVTGITTTGDFAETNNCGPTLAANATCAITVTFTPTEEGARSGTLNVTDDTSSSPQMVTLSGVGMAPEVMISPSALSFPSTPLRSTSGAKTLTLMNIGNEPLSAAKIAVSGDFAEKDTCSVSVAAGAACVIYVTFTPTGQGSRTGTLTATDNSNVAAGSTQSVSLGGEGAGPTMSLSSTALTFSGETTGTTSAAQDVTLSNTGNAALTIASVAISGDFAQTNTCGGSVTAGGNCTISVTFKPVAAGTRSGAITISDNAPGAPHSITLSGTGQDFTVAPPAGSSSSATVTAGQPANYTLSVGGEGGMSGTVTFTCTGAPSEATCTVSPNPATIGATADVTVTVTTTSRGASALRTPPLSCPPAPPILLLSLVALLAASLWALRSRPRFSAARRRMVLLPMAAGLLLALVLAACGGGGGGGGGNSGGVTNPGTPAGTYTLTVTGTEGTGSAAVSHVVSLTLVVS